MNENAWINTIGALLAALLGTLVLIVATLLLLVSHDVSQLYQILLGLGIILWLYAAISALEATSRKDLIRTGLAAIIALALAHGSGGT